MQCVTRGRPILQPEKLVNLPRPEPRGLPRHRVRKNQVLFRPRHRDVEQPIALIVLTNLQARGVRRSPGIFAAAVFFLVLPPQPQTVLRRERNSWRTLPPSVLYRGHN